MGKTFTRNFYAFTYSVLLLHTLQFHSLSLQGKLINIHDQVLKSLTITICKELWLADVHSHSLMVSQAKHLFLLSSFRVSKIKAQKVFKIQQSNISHYFKHLWYTCWATQCAKQFMFCNPYMNPAEWVLLLAQFYK